MRVLQVFEIGRKTNQATTDAGSGARFSGLHIAAALTAVSGAPADITICTPNARAAAPDSADRGLLPCVAAADAYAETPSVRALYSAISLAMKDAAGAAKDTSAPSNAFSAAPSDVYAAA